MMRGIRRLAVCTAATGLLAAVAVGINIETAHAQQSEVTSCTGASTNTVPWQCTIDTTIPSTSGITMDVTDNTGTSNEDVTVDVTTLSCTYNSTTDTEPASEETGETPLTDNVSPLPLTAETGTCDIVVTTSTPTTDSSGATITPDEFTATLYYTPIASTSTSTSASATPTTTTTAASVNGFKGYKGMCVDDNGNSSANRAKIQIWTCGSGDKAEAWTFSNNELVHNGKCANDQGDAGSGGKVILYSCGSAGNDKWSELSNGEFKLKAHNGTLCLNDARNSTKNGTQLIVYKCTDSANEKWSKSIA